MPLSGVDALSVHHVTGTKTLGYKALGGNIPAFLSFPCLYKFPGANKGFGRSTKPPAMKSAATTPRSSYLFVMMVPP
jgi:hypothetical protein